MDTVNSNPNETAAAPAPAAAVPEMKEATITNATPAAAPAVAPASAPVAAAPVVAAAPAAPAKPAVPVVNGPLPKTDGKTPGGWNRFAGYDPKAAKNKSNDRGGGKRR